MTLIVWVSQFPATSRLVHAQQRCAARSRRPHPQAAALGPGQANRPDEGHASSLRAKVSVALLLTPDQAVIVYNRNFEPNQRTNFNLTQCPIKFTVYILILMRLAVVNGLIHVGLYGILIVLIFVFLLSTVLIYSHMS